MMRRRAITVGATLLACTLASLSTARVSASNAGKNRAHQDFPPQPGSTAIICICPPSANPPSGGTNTPGSSPSGPTASKKPRTSPSQKAVRIAMKDPYVRRLIRGRRVHISQVAPWSDRRTPRGRVVIVALARTSTVHGQWVALHAAPYRATYTDVSGLRVYVNMATSKVVGVLPWVPKR